MKARADDGEKKSRRRKDFSPVCCPCRATVRPVLGIRAMLTKKVLTIFPVEFIYVWRASQRKGARGKVRTSMSKNLTHSHSIVAAGRRASERTCADLFSAAMRGAAAAVVCPGSLPVYLPGGVLMSESAKSMINLWDADRRVSLI